MTGTELAIFIAVIVCQTVTISLWLAAASHARWWHGQAEKWRDNYEHLSRNSLRRDPRTGRYVKKVR